MTTADSAPQRRLLWIIAVIAVPVVLGGVYLASPFVSIGVITAALLAGDQARLECNVDFPSVRAGLKEDLKAQMNKQAAKKDNPWGQLGAAVGLALIDPLVDACVTPAGIASLVQNAKVKGLPSKTDKTTPPPPAQEGKQLKVRRCWFTAVSEFQVEYDNGVKLRLQRRGLRWQLTRIILPASHS
jgi:hypothetical protein